MGCGTSKSELQDMESPSPAVALCRERCSLLELALHQRFTFAQAHAAYLLSLDSFALSLHRFSILNLPPRNSHSHSESDSHSHSSPHLHHTYAPPDYHDGGYFFNTISHMKGQTPPSLSHTQPEKQTMSSMYVAQAQLLSASPPSSDNNLVNPPPHSTATTANNQNHNPPSYSSPDHNFLYSNSNNNNNNTNYGAAGPAGGLLGANSSLPAAPSSSSNAPPPPPPPRSLTWDFLNPFDTAVGSFYPADHDSREREEREAEGIPDLEDDVVVIKEIHVDQRFLGDGSGTSGIRSKPSVADHAALAQERIEDGGNASAGTSFKGGEPEVVREIQLQFERASDSGSELAKFLEVGKLPYNGKSRTTQAVAVASKILHLPLASLCKGTDPTVLNLDEVSELSSINLSSTLHKLCLWEKKLYKEVKVEEKMRVLRERKSRGLKHLDETGAENPKVDATRNLVRSLSTKIKIAMQVVDKISVKIYDLRDGELWPQLQELIHRLTKMWRSMAECHGNQWRAVREAKEYLDGIASFHKQQCGDAHCEATCQLERDLIKWTLSFSCWVTAQKDYARMLNDWLMKCVHYAPEETADGIPPFSPGRIGAPPVFVVCNEWSKSINRISEKEVMDSMREFASHVLLLWDQEKAEMMSLKKKKDGRSGKFKKRLEKEDHKIRKEIHALDKRMMLLTCTGPLTGGSGRGQATLQVSLQHVLEAMEKFAASSLKIYEELLKCMDKELGLGSEDPMKRSPTLG